MQLPSQPEITEEPREHDLPIAELNAAPELVDEIIDIEDSDDEVFFIEPIPKRARI